MSRVLISYGPDGRPTLIHFNVGTTDPVWARLPFNPTNKTFSESDPLTIQLRQWEATNGAINLSDRAPSPQTPDLDWKQFRRTMWPNAGFRRMVKDSTDKDSVVDLKVAAGIATEDWMWLKLLWDACVDGLAVKPTAAEITSWNAVVNGARVGTIPAPFTFGSDGKLVLQ
jgi:hypothetical protein